MSEPTHRRNPFFPLAAFASVLFIITILALVAGVLGDSRAPLAQLLDRYAGRLIAGEVAAILITGFLAMFVDRRQAKQSLQGTGRPLKKGTVPLGNTDLSGKTHSLERNSPLFQQAPQAPHVQQNQG